MRDKVPAIQYDSLSSADKDGDMFRYYFTDSDNSLQQTKVSVQRLTEEGADNIIFKLIEVFEETKP